MREVTIRPPGDKSISHRALFVAALARGTSEITGILPAGDVRSTASILRRLGVEISPLVHGREVAVRSRGRRLVPPTARLHCGNSGTTARLALGLLAAQPFAAWVTGDPSLRQRPMRRVTEPLERMGALFPRGGERLPLAVCGGSLQPLDYRSPVASAQVKSAIMLAGVAGRVPVRVTEPSRSRDHTERLLRALGLDVSADGEAVVLVPGEIEPFRLAVPGDPSSAAFLLAAALLCGDVCLKLTGVGVNPTRTGFLAVLKRMGAPVAVMNTREQTGEPVADLVAKSAELHGTEVNADEIPTLIDEVPVLAVLASRARGRTVFRDVGELRIKESDRLSLLARNLAALGVRTAAAGESLVVEGTKHPPVGTVQTHGDHRIAMAFAVLGTVPHAQLRLSEQRSVAVSYPTFFDDLRQVTGAARHRH